MLRVARADEPKQALLDYRSGAATRKRKERAAKKNAGTYQHPTAAGNGAGLLRNARRRKKLVRTSILQQPVMALA